LAGKLTVPALGTSAADGQACPTSRSFMVVDAAQSIGVLTSYLLLGRRTAQNTAANRAAQTTATVISHNLAANGILVNNILPAVGCTPMTAPNVADANAAIAALVTLELQADRFQGFPQAMVPVNDLTAVAAGATVAGVTIVRNGVNQPAPADLNQCSAKTYCSNVNTVGVPRITASQTTLAKAATPTGTTSTNLDAYLVTRYQTTMGTTGLNCAAQGVPTIL